jgi:hypothetical protein
VFFVTSSPEDAMLPDYFFGKSKKAGNFPAFIDSSTATSSLRVSPQAPPEPPVPCWALASHS